MEHPPRVRFSHIGIHVRDMDTMVDFYTRLLGLEVTDRGLLAIPGNPEVTFLSQDPEEHHQIAFAAGRPDGPDAGPVLNQISFSVGSLAELRQMKAAAEALGIERILPLNHGNAWSIYFADPEGNPVEVFARSPWHVRQPVTDGLDLSRSDEEIVGSTEAVYSEAPDFGPARDWRESFARRLEERWSR